MSNTTIERQKLIEIVNTLPNEVLVELSNFLDYLRYKNDQYQNPNPSSHNFLLSVAGIGQSEQEDISERDETILHNEINPVYGWNSKPSKDRGDC